VRKKDMAVFHFLKRFFSNTPDWLLGGLIVVSLLWLVVWPVEIIEIVIRQEYIPESFLGWSVKFLYMGGYAISLFLIAPIADYSSAPDQLVGIFIVLLGLLITSPVYFLIGAFLAVGKDSTITLGLVLVLVHFALSYLVTIWLIKFLFSG
jgi:hypothetical protein